MVRCLSCAVLVLDLCDVNLVLVYLRQICTLDSVVLFVMEYDGEAWDTWFRGLSLAAQGKDVNT